MELGGGVTEWAVGDCSAGGSAGVWPQPQRRPLLGSCTSPAPVEGADALCTAVAMVVNEEGRLRERQTPPLPPLSSAAPHLLLVSGHLRDANFCSSQSRLANSIRALTSLGFSIQLIDAASMGDSTSHTTDSAVTAASSPSSCVWLDALRLLPSVLPMLYCSWQEAEGWLSVAASVVPMTACRGSLILGELGTSSSARSVGASSGFSDWRALKEAVAEVAAEAESMRPRWRCAVLLLPASRPTPEPSHVQVHHSSERTIAAACSARSHHPHY